MRFGNSIGRNSEIERGDARLRELLPKGAHDLIYKYFKEADWTDKATFSKL